MNLKTLTALVLTVMMGVSFSVRDVQAQQVSNADLVKMVQQLKQQVNELQGQISAMKGEGGRVMPDVPSVNSDVPAWIRGTNFGGDVRVRWQTNPSNKTSDSNRLRLRLKYGISKQVNDELAAGFRIATGSQSHRSYYADAGSGNNAGFDKFDVWIDQLYLKYTPTWWKGSTFWAGKFKPNWGDKGNLIHPDGAGYEGAGQSLRFDLADDLNGYLDMAQLVVTSSTAQDADMDSELFVFKTGFDYTFNSDSNPVKWGLYGTSYIFAGYRDGADDDIGTGNSASMDNPRVFLVTTDCSFDAWGMPVSMYAEAAKNFNADTEGSDVRDQDKYYAVGLGLNKLKKPGDISAGYKFVYMENDVFPDGLVDADLGTGQHAHYAWVNYRWFASTDLNITAIAPRSLQADRDTERLFLKFNLTTKF